MSDPTFYDAVAGRAWIVDPDPFACLEPGWAALFVDALDKVGALMARHPGEAIRDLSVREKSGGLQVVASTALPPDGEGDVRALWREAEERSTRTCQFCGQPGRLRCERRLWWETACDVHA